MANSEELKTILSDLFASQKLAVLATDETGQPYTSLMAFAVTADLSRLIIATSRATRKYANLCTNSRVALLIDNRAGQAAVLSDATAVTTLGQAEEIGEVERDQLQKLYLAKHPELEEFVKKSTCALVQVRVECYYVVSEFQTVEELRFER